MYKTQMTVDRYGTGSRHLCFVCAFSPFLYASPEDAAVLRPFWVENRLDETLTLNALRRHKNWAIELPIGTFVNELRPGVASFEEDYAAREAAMEHARKVFNYQQLRRERAFIRFEGALYYHQNAIGLLRRHVEHPAFLNAVHAFLRAAQLDLTLIKGPPKHRRPFIPLTQRVEVFGHTARGPAWTPEEDQVLRQWFGKRTVGDLAGQHTALTSDEWQRVFDALGQRRSKASIRQRINGLNNILRRSMCVEGYVPRDRLREYMDLALGEKPRRPRAAPIPKPRKPRSPQLRASLPVESHTSN